MLHNSFAGLEQTQSNQVSYFRFLVAYVPCLQGVYLTFFFTALDVKRLGVAVKVSFFLIIVLIYTYKLHGSSILADRPILMKYCMTIQLLSVIGQLTSLFLFFLYWSPSIGKSHMTPVSFVKITESYEVFGHHQSASLV